MPLRDPSHYLAVDDALRRIRAEVERAKDKHPGELNSPHEGISVIREEFEELWDEVKKQGGGRNADAKKEAIQVAAMAVRYITELCK